MLDSASIAAEIDRVDQLFGAGRRREAEETCRQLLHAAPTSGISWLRLGLILLDRQENAEAETALRQALEYEPGAAVIWNQLGLALHRQALAPEAEVAVRRATALEPANPTHWHLLGTTLFDQRRLDAAVEAYHHSLAIEPRNPAAWNDLGGVEQARSRFTEAEQAFQKSLSLAPNHPSGVANYAFFLCQRGQQDKACELLQQAVVRDPFSPQGWLLMGEIFESMSQWGLAAAAYRRAWDMVPQDEHAGLRLAKMLQADYKFTAAEQVILAHLERFPQQADSLALLGEVLIRQGRTAEALEYAQRAVNISADPHRHSRLLLELQYDDHVSPQQLFTMHRNWNAAHAKRLLPTTPSQLRQPTGAPLRIGVVSSEFGHSPAAFLTLPAFEHLPRADCELVCYSDRTNDDEYTIRFRAAASGWRVIFGRSDEQVAALIQRDKIDVLIDLMGHTGRRMLLFARKPAPFQMSWLGYASTTGLPAIDCLLADRFHIHPGEERWYSEQVLRMPNGYACYGPPQTAPAVGPLPALGTGHITFGCFNNSAKYSVTIREIWAEILCRLPTSQLLLKFQGLDDVSLQSNLRQWFEQHGVAGQRILIEGWSPHAELLAAYNRVDIALDTQPYSGGLTTCESLWMGVPVITYPGQTFAGRHSTSYLTNAGYEQFVAPNAKGYVQLALDWSNRLNELAQVRAGLRDRMQSYPVCDAPRFAYHLWSVLTATLRTKT